MQHHQQYPQLYPSSASQHHQQQQHLYAFNDRSPYLPHLFPHQRPNNQLRQQPQQHQQQFNQVFYQPQTNFTVSHNGPFGSQGQATTAANFFARSQQQQPQPQNHQKILCQSQPGTRSSSPGNDVFVRSKSHGRMGGGHNRGRKYEADSSEERDQFPTNFRVIVHRSPPPIPSGLLRRLESSIGDAATPSGLGKIKVIVRVSKATNCFDPQQEQEHKRHFQVDKRKRQITLYDPSLFRGISSANDDALHNLEERKAGVTAPKMFAFDGLFTCEDSQEDVGAAALPEVIQSVLNGNDGCVFCYGHANLGKTRTMLGSDECSKDLGIVPMAVAWLYKAIKERKAKTTARFSVRVSALEITSQREEVKDLLSAYDTADNDLSPAAYLPRTGTGSCLQNMSELRASSAEKAAYYLDAALAGRSLDAQGRESHLVFTVHVYQYSSKQAGSAPVHSGRSRLHLIDFGGCERTKTQGGGITLSGLGNVILGIFNGQKHLPHRDSKVTQVLRECLGSLTCQTTMIAHVSAEACRYSETLHTVQLASRLHRMRRKLLKNSGSGRRGPGSTSSDEQRRLRKLRSGGRRSGGSSSSGLSSSDLTSTAYSSSEMSCDTVVYRGQSDGSGTDCEQPPIFRPSLRTTSRLSGGSSEGSLRGSYDDIPRRRKILTNGAISPRRNLSPQSSANSLLLPQNQAAQNLIRNNNHQLLRSPNRSLSSLPVIHEVNVNSDKMPLNGLVPVQSRQRMMMMKAAAVNNNRQKSAPASGNSRNEQWVDVAPPPQPASKAVFGQEAGAAVGGRKRQMQRSSSAEARTTTTTPSSYGYMDEQKANMISTWVENQQQSPQDEQEEEDDVENEPPSQNQRQEENFRALTQFKTACDNNRETFPHQQSNIAAVDIHDHGTNNKPTSRRGPPPPPPPRRTTPCKSSSESLTGMQQQQRNLNALVAECNELVKVFEAEAAGDNEARVEIDDDDDVNNDPREHPLRILSEENLTVVSSFTGSRERLNDADADFDADRIDPSKLSFFQVPDFSSLKDDIERQEDMIAKRFKEFAQLEKGIEKTEEPPPTIDLTSPPEQEFLLTFSRHNNNNGEVEDEEKKPASSTAEEEKRETICMTPQKQFQLLAQSLRHPDGSSNPELHLTAVNKNNNDAEVPKQRSPGNGRSSSDMEEDVKNHNNSNASTAKLQDNAVERCDNLRKDKAEEHEVKAKKEPTNNNRFAFRFLKIFGSSRKLNKKDESSARRSKSCDSRGGGHNNNSNNKKSTSNAQIRPANSSPSIKETSKKNINKQQQQQPPLQLTGTPSTLSLSTEWEYENGNNEEMEEDDDNDYNNFNTGIVRSARELIFGGPQNNPHQPPSSRVSSGKVFPLSSSSSTSTAVVKTDRKSSGYDSLGGESSSLDSNEDKEVNNAIREKLRRCEEEMEVENVPYVNPNDIQILQYDELDIMRMEQRPRYGSIYH